MRNPSAVPDKERNPIDVDMDTDSQLNKPKAEILEYLEDGDGMIPGSAEFKKKEAKLVRKLDIFIAPVMMMLMLISYLDRGNIGFAATQGMADDIGLKGSELNVNKTALFGAYNALTVLTGSDLPLLRLLRTGRGECRSLLDNRSPPTSRKVPSIPLRQTPPIQSCHPRHHLLLGHHLHVHRLHPKLRRSRSMSTHPRLLRRLPLPQHDPLTRQLVQARRIGYASRLLIQYVNSSPS